MTTPALRQQVLALVRTELLPNGTNIPRVIPFRIIVVSCCVSVASEPASGLGRCAADGGNHHAGGNSDSSGRCGMDVPRGQVLQVDNSSTIPPSRQHPMAASFAALAGRQLQAHGTSLTAQAYRRPPWSVLGFPTRRVIHSATTEATVLPSGPDNAPAGQLGTARGLMDEREMLEQIRACTDADDLLDLLEPLVRIQDQAAADARHDVAQFSDSARVAGGRPPPLPDVVATEALLQLSILPYRNPPPASEEAQERRQRRRQRRNAVAAVAATADGVADADAVEALLPTAATVTCDVTGPGSESSWRRRRALVAGLFRQLEPLYGTMDLATQMALLEACSRLTWLLGRCRHEYDKPAHRRGGGGDDEPRWHPAHALLDVVLPQDRGAKLLVAAAPPPPPSPATVSAAATASPAGRVLAALGRLRVREPKALEELLIPLMEKAAQRDLGAADLAAVVAAAADLRPAAHPYILWADVCACLAAPGALRQLPAAELVRLAQSLAELEAEWTSAPAAAVRRRDDSNYDLYQDPDLSHGYDEASRAAAPEGRGCKYDELYDDFQASSYALDPRAGVDQLGGEGAEERLLLAALAGEVAERAAAAAGLSGGQVVQLMAAAAKLGMREPAVLQPLAAAARRRLPGLRPDEISQLACATARLGFADPPLIDAISYTVAAVQRADPASYNVRSLSIVAWALACHGRPCPDLFSEEVATALAAGMRTTAPPSEAAEPPPPLRLRPHEVANALWAFARQGARHEGLLAAALRRSAVWERRGRLPRRKLIKVLWAASKLGYVPSVAALNDRSGDGGGGGGGGGGNGEETHGGEDLDGDALLLSERVVEVVLDQAQRLDGAELVQAAEALEPYCTAGGPLYDKYGREVYQRLMEAALDRVAGLRPDACVALLSTLSRATSTITTTTPATASRFVASCASPTSASGGGGGAATPRPLSSAAPSPPPLPSLDSRLLLRAQQRLTPPLESGQLSVAQLLELLEVLRREDARAAPLLLGLEQQLLKAVGPAAAAAGVATVAPPPLSGEQAAVALATLGSLQRHGALAELFRLTHAQVVPALERQPPEDIARLLRLLGAAVQRSGGGRLAAALPPSLPPPPPSSSPAGFNKQQKQQQNQPIASGAAAAAAAAAAAVLGPGVGTFLDVAWAALARPGCLEKLTAAQLIDATWGLAACGYDEPEAYDKLAARLQGRVKSLPAWSLARLAAAMHGHGLGPTVATAVVPTNRADAVTTGGRRSHGGQRWLAAATTDENSDGGDGGRSLTHLQRHPVLAERIAKYGTQELARPGGAVKPQDLATLTEVFATAAPQYGGLFLAAAHRARRWQQEAEELEEEAEGRDGHRRYGTGGRADDVNDEVAGGGQVGELREAAARVRIACEAAGYDVSDVLGPAPEERMAGRVRGGRDGRGDGGGGGGSGFKRGPYSAREAAASPPAWEGRERSQRPGAQRGQARRSGGLTAAPAGAAGRKMWGVRGRAGGDGRGGGRSPVRASRQEDWEGLSW